MDKPFRPCYEPQYVTSTLAFHNEIKASSAQPANCGIKESEGCVGNESPTVLEFMAVAYLPALGRFRKESCKGHPICFRNSSNGNRSPGQWVRLTSLWRMIRLSGML